MIKNKFVVILLLVYVFSDFLFSYIQHYHQPLYGELDGCVLPSSEIQKIFDDPLGFKILKSGQGHINPNRYFSHAPLSLYFKHVPLWLQNFMSPIDSVYVASALIKIITQLIFVLGLAMLVSGSKRFFNKDTLLGIVLILPLFQVYGYYSRMAIIDRSVLYTFFYGTPLVILMLVFICFFNVLRENRQVSLMEFILILPLTVMLTLSCPLIAPVFLIVSLLMVINSFYKHGLNLKSAWDELSKVPVLLTILWILFNIMSLYSLYLGFFNSNFEKDVIPIGERYMRLPSGIVSQLFHSPGFPLMIIIIAINQYLLRRNLSAGEFQYWKKQLFWITIFSIVYVILIPLGGYRPYRPKLIRYDMIMPVTMALIYYFGASTYKLIGSLKDKIKIRYVAAITAVLLFYVLSDTQGIHRNKPEREAMEMIARSNDSVVAIPPGVVVIGYQTVTEPQQSIEKAKLMYYWKITDRQKLFYNLPEKQ